MIVSGALRRIPKGLVKGLVLLEIEEQAETHPNYSIYEVGQNTEKSPGMKTLNGAK